MVCGVSDTGPAAYCRARSARCGVQQRSADGDFRQNIPRLHLDVVTATLHHAPRPLPEAGPGQALQVTVQISPGTQDLGSLLLALSQCCSSEEELCHNTQPQGAEDREDKKTIYGGHRVCAGS